MKQTFIIQNHAPRLLMFFAGWAADETPFRDYVPQGRDYLICYDYRSMKFDDTLLMSYDEIDVVGWSMGVWAATRIVPQLRSSVCSCTAINGTPYPIDTYRGIPPEIYQGTLDNLCGASLHKFLRRMCANSLAFKRFLEVTPRRPLDEIRDELAEIARQAETTSPSNIAWTEAVVGLNDRIIPPANQLRAWQELGVPVRQTQDAHYEKTTFQYYLQDRWIQDE